MEKPKRVWDEGTYIGELETRAAATGTRKRATSCGNEEHRYKYNTYNFNKKLSTPPQSESLSLRLRCVFCFCVTSLICVSALRLRCVCELLVSPSLSTLYTFPLSCRESLNSQFPQNTANPTSSPFLHNLPLRAPFVVCGWWISQDIIVTRRFIAAT